MLNVAYIHICNTPHYFASTAVVLSVVRLDEQVSKHE